MLYLENQNFNILCSKCGKRYDFPSKNISLETYTSERSIGKEIEHFWNYSGKCPSCSFPNFFHIIAYEYPPGILCYKEKHTTNCNIKDYSIKVKQ